MTGTKFDDDGKHLVPNDEFDTVLLVLRMLNQGSTWAKIEEEAGIPQRTLANIIDRRNEYIELARAHGHDIDDLLDGNESSEAVSA